jgi:endo-1,4-beta-xylanase
MTRWTRRDLVQAGFGAAGLAALAHTAAAAEPGPDSLETLARAKGLHFGTALGGRGLADAGYVDLIREQCGIIVPDNAFKMPFIQPRPGEFNFERGDAIAAFAATNNLLLRGHCLLWHHPRWLPRWMTEDFDFGTDRAAGAEKFLVDHISRTTKHYEKSVMSWDVVYEAVDNITGEMRETPLSKAIGSPDKVLEIAFRAARANLPNIELVYNDYMGWEPDSAAHRAGVLKLLERFRKNGVPVNALGLQAHLGAGNQENDAARAFDARSERAWRKFLEDVTGMGYTLLITEFDVHDTPLPADFTRRDAAVAALGRAFLDVTLAFTQLSAMLCWGLMDTHSWLQGRSPRADGLPKRPTPYDNHYQPKPLREAVAAALQAAPPRRPASIAGIPA